MTISLTASQELLGTGIILGVGELPATYCVGDAGITNGGTGYTSAPTVAFTGGGGTQAAATAIVSSQSVVALVMTNRGSAYTAAPTIGFSGGGGTGAAATAIMMLGPVSSYTNFSKIEDIGIPSFDVAKINATTHDQINKKEKNIPGFMSATDATLDCLYQKVCTTTIEQMIAGKATYGWKIILPERSTLEFNAWFLNRGISSPLKDLMRHRFNLCIEDSILFWTQGS